MTEETRMTVRMPADLYEWLKSNADTHRRSLNSQVVEILDAYRRAEVLRLKAEQASGGE